MIIVQTPLRVSFLGGGTDFEDFYQENGGAVLSTAIDKFVFVVIKERFDNLIYVNYSKKEIVENIDDLNHDLVREAMRLTGVREGVEITNLADIPTEGTGLGSSSSFTVALLQALYAYRGESKPAELLANEACRIEIDILGSPIGKQDQYIAAYGGLRFITFNGNGIKVEAVPIPNGRRRRFGDNFLLFYSGVTRKANGILAEQKTNITDRIETLCKMRDMAYEARNAIIAGEYDALGEIMHHGWELKRQMAIGISNGVIDQIYEAARKAGAIGGKVTGAGGGGFLLFYCPPGKQDDVRAALHGLRELPFLLENDGSKVVFDHRRAN